VRRDRHLLAGAYVLHALPPRERRRFARHLRTCSSCGDEARSLAETTAVLAVAAATPPPPGLRARVLGEVARSAPQPRTALMRVPRLAWGRLGVAVVALSVVVALVAGGALLRAQRRLEHLRAQQERLVSLVAAPDARVVRGQAAGVMTTAVVSRSRGRVAFVVSGLERLPSTKTYELWFIGPAGARPAALLGAAPRPETVTVAEGLGDARQLGVTVEPEEGSPAPTTTPVVGLSVS
jgi:anti-sigma-K factor RskA